MESKYIFKVADNEHEFELIARLNYDTFVNEIPQHEQNEAQMLQDKFHNQNSYFICMDGDSLVGMVTLRDQRPFSLDHKLPDLDAYFSSDLRICEVRLLSVRKDKRSGKIALNLIRMAGEYFLRNHYDLLIISAVLKQLKLYSKLGLMPFGPVVGSDDVQLQPMYLTPEYARAILPDLILNEYISLEEPEDYNYLPGPVKHEEHTVKGLGRQAVSHRGLDYKLLLGRVKWRLKALTGAKYVQLFLGSGTLVNDVVAGQISLLGEPGLIMTNGEFGNRLCNNADGFGLKYSVFSADYGSDFDLVQLDQYLTENSDVKWLWFVHLETSSGVVNNYKKIVTICKKYGIKVCADCISSLGNVPLDLSQFYLASSVAGKGLCSYTGLSMVFYNHELMKPKSPLPCYMDLWKYDHLDGVPYSGNSNLLRALHQALEHEDFEKRFSDIRDAFNWTRDELREAGLRIINHGDSGNVVLSIRLPETISSTDIGNKLESAGYKMHFRSKFLTGNNILQVSFMSRDSLQKSHSMVEQFRACIADNCYFVV